jgi:hypothetical protein
MFIRFEVKQGRQTLLFRFVRFNQNRTRRTLGRKYQQKEKEIRSVLLLPPGIYDESNVWLATFPYLYTNRQEIHQSLLRVDVFGRVGIIQRYKL